MKALRVVRGELGNPVVTHHHDDGGLVELFPLSIPYPPRLHDYRGIFIDVFQTLDPYLAVALANKARPGSGCRAYSLQFRLDAELVHEPTAHQVQLLLTFGNRVAVPSLRPLANLYARMIRYALRDDWPQSLEAEAGIQAFRGHIYSRGLERGEPLK